MSEKREMSAVEYLREKERMNNSGVYFKRIEKCKQCLGKSICLEICDGFETKYPEECVEFVQNWAEEHPVKTMLQDFFEKFPNAPKEELGDPKLCPSACGYTAKDLCDGSEFHKCFVCWNRPLEVEE